MAADATSGKPETVEPALAKPRSAGPVVGKPAAVKASPPKSAAAKSGQAKSTVTKPVAERSSAKATAAAPTKAPSGAKPATSQPSGSAAAIADEAVQKPRAAKGVAPFVAPAADAIVVPTKPVDKTVDADAEGGKKDKRDKVVRDSFSIPASEHVRLKALRVDLAKAGRLVSKSEVLRAGLRLLGERSIADLTALIDALPPVVKGKRSKKH